MNSLPGSNSRDPALTKRAAQLPPVFFREVIAKRIGRRRDVPEGSAEQTRRVHVREPDLRRERWARSPDLSRMQSVNWLRVESDRAYIGKPAARPGFPEPRAIQCSLDPDFLESHKRSAPEPQRALNLVTHPSQAVHTCGAFFLYHPVATANRT